MKEKWEKRLGDYERKVKVKWGKERQGSRLKRNLPAEDLEWPVSDLEFQVGWGYNSEVKGRKPMGWDSWCPEVDEEEEEEEEGRSLLYKDMILLTWGTSKVSDMEM